MSKQARSKKAGQTNVPRLNLLKLEQTFFQWQEKEHNVKECSFEVFDGWVCYFVESVTGVNRTWDVFARWRFINTLLAMGILSMQANEADGKIMLIEVEEKASSAECQLEEKASTSQVA